MVEDNHIGMGGVRIGYLLLVARLLALARLVGESVDALNAKPRALIDTHEVTTDASGFDFH